MIGQGIIHSNVQLNVPQNVSTNIQVIAYEKHIQR